MYVCVCMCMYVYVCGTFMHTYIHTYKLVRCIDNTMQLFNMQQALKCIVYYIVTVMNSVLLIAA